MAAFTAEFTPESGKSPIISNDKILLDPEFNVIPKEGMLDPYGREGTTFVISFTPMQYGKIKNAKLIIQTEEMYW